VRALDGLRRYSASNAVRPGGRGERATGELCIARSRTSRHDVPSLTSAGGAHDHRRGDLDGLQDDPVAERVGAGDPVGAGQDGHAGGLEDAEVRRGDRQHGGDVDGEQDRRRGAEPGPVVEPERDQQQ
jgi:hypothetical protein